MTAAESAAPGSRPTDSVTAPRKTRARTPYVAWYLRVYHVVLYHIVLYHIVLYHIVLMLV